MTVRLVQLLDDQPFVGKVQPTRDLGTFADEAAADAKAKELRSSAVAALPKGLDASQALKRLPKFRIVPA